MDIIHFDTPSACGGEPHYISICNRNVEPENWHEVLRVLLWCDRGSIRLFKMTYYSITLIESRVLTLVSSQNSKKMLVIQSISALGVSVPVGLLGLQM